jgi:hypothetical protein
MDLLEPIRAYIMPTKYNEQASTVFTPIRRMYNNRARKVTAGLTTRRRAKMQWWFCQSLGTEQNNLCFVYTLIKKLHFALRH